MKIKANQSKRTFTIYSSGSRYRTLPVAKNDFQDMEMNTWHDWKDFLRNESGSYYKVR